MTDIHTETSARALRATIRTAYLCDEATAVKNLMGDLGLSVETRHQICLEAIAIVEELRRSKSPGIMETFLAEYGLTTEEGVALMCMAEALLRVPDDTTIDALIRDKIAPANWSRHLGHSTSPLVNTSTWALLLTGKVIDPAQIKTWNIGGQVRKLIKRAGEPVIRTAVTKSMKIMGHQFVLGRNIKEATDRAQGMEAKGYTYSYDMLGEAAHTAQDAQQYFMAYSKAISVLSEACDHNDTRDNPGISVKLSALHPRYEFSKRTRILDELAPRVDSLVRLAKNANMGFNIDAEEAERLDLSLDVIETVLSNPDLQGWDGFGVVVQAYAPRAPYVLNWLYNLAERLDRRIMVRLVKGAYWDTEIKLAQVEGLEGYSVFTRKASTDICYMACAKKLLAMTDRIYPQFATHNAHTVAAILNMAGQRDDFEFQRLHGMGEALYDVVRSHRHTRCRIYAPVGVHEDLLAYLVRRLLENGANSSFVNQVLDESIPPKDIVRDPVELIENQNQVANPRIPLPRNIYDAERINSAGFNLSNPAVLDKIDAARNAFKTHTWQASPEIKGKKHDGKVRSILNPANHSDHVGDVVEATPAQVEAALVRADSAVVVWRERPVEERANCLDRLADLYEAHAEELIALACREAGKSLPDGIGEIREAVDFCRYYAKMAPEMFATDELEGRGIFVCISPWNFPLAIFTGQISAALVAGNPVIAKPAEQTPLIASRAVELMHEAGIPADVIQLLPGDGPIVGAALVSSPHVAGVCFTGSTETAQAINKAMAENANPAAPLIAETGGLNAMIVDSTALPEQAVRDIVTSAFQSAGQRCSALRVLYVQTDVSDNFIEMLKGAMDELLVGDPWNIATDVGPVIDNEAGETIRAHCLRLEDEGRLIKKVDLGAEAGNGTFVAPAVYRIDSIEQLEKEIFGPVLHVATFKAKDLDRVIATINATHYGLTMGVHTRVDHRVQQVYDKARVGNLYINRNQIGAVVGVQPFGGEGLSGTGPKAGGPNYLYRFARKTVTPIAIQASSIFTVPDFGFSAKLSHVVAASMAAQVEWNCRRDRKDVLTRMTEKTGNADVNNAINGALRASNDYNDAPLDLTGPTGETNQLSLHGRGVFICVGRDALQFAALTLLTGNGVVMLDESNSAHDFVKTAVDCGLSNDLLAVISGPVDVAAFQSVNGLAGVGVSLAEKDLRAIRQSLALRQGPILPLLTDPTDWRGFVTERSLCIDTTASGGNATLLATAEIELAPGD